MNPWNTDEELAQLAKTELFTAVVGDVMDTMGLTRQFLPPEIRPLRDNMVVFGRAMPVLIADYFSERVNGKNAVASQPFGLLFHALDDLQPGEVYLATGGSLPYALWGELLSTRALQLSAAGAALEKARGENQVRQALENGMSAVEAFDKFGIM